MSSIIKWHFQLPLHIISCNKINHLLIIYLFVFCHNLQCWAFRKIFFHGRPRIGKTLRVVVYTKRKVIFKYANCYSCLPRVVHSKWYCLPVCAFYKSFCIFIFDRDERLQGEAWKLTYRRGIHGLRFCPKNTTESVCRYRGSNSNSSVKRWTRSQL